MGKNKPEWDENQWQGRSRKQIETNYRVLDITIITGIISFIGIMIYRVITTL